MTNPSPLPIPLVCEPELLAGAELRAWRYPDLGYDWCIKYAPRPISSARLSSLSAERLAEVRRAHRRTTNRLGMAWDR